MTEQRLLRRQTSERVIDADLPSVSTLVTTKLIRNEVVFVVLFVLICLVVTVGPRNEVADAWLLFMPGPDEGFEWELALCVTLLCFFFALPFLNTESRSRASSTRTKAYFYGLLGLLVVLFALFDTSVDLRDLLDDGNYTQHDVNERKENLLITILNLVLIAAITQITLLRTRFQLTAEEAMRFKLAEKTN